MTTDYLLLFFLLISLFLVLVIIIAIIRKDHIRIMVYGLLFIIFDIGLCVVQIIQQSSWIAVVINAILNFLAVEIVATAIGKIFCKEK